MAKYAPLCDHLKRCSGPVTMTFGQIADLVGGLPPSAAEYSAWWDNDDTTHVQSRSWGDAGYVAHPNLGSRTVLFEPK